MRTEYFWPSVRRDLERTERSRTLHPRKKKKFEYYFETKNQGQTKKKKSPKKNLNHNTLVQISTINIINITMYIFTIPELILKLIYKLGTD